MYEELVKSLRICSRCDFGQDCNGCTQKSDDAFCCDKLLHEAADAIEQLSADLERSIDWSGFWQEEAGEVLKKFQTTVAKIPRWIPVAERLPKEGEFVLVYGDLYPNKHDGGVIAVSKCMDWNYWQWFGRERDITHWMPLPEPPKDGES